MLSVDRAEYAAYAAGVQFYRYRVSYTPTVSRTSLAVAASEPFNLEGFLRVFEGVRKFAIYLVLNLFLSFFTSSGQRKRESEYSYGPP